MKSPEEVSAAIRKRWVRNIPQWLAAPEEASVSVPLHPPTAARALADPAAVDGWVEAWRSTTGALREHVIWEERRWAQLGTQRLPVRWEASGARALARAAGAATQREAELLTARHQAAVELLEEHAEIAPGDLPLTVATAINRGRAQWLRMSDADTDLSIRVASWLLENPSSGLRIRQVPFPGMHTKWLTAHRTLVGGLVGAVRADGGENLGLAPAPVFHDLLVLEPSYRTTSGGPDFPRASRLALTDLSGIEIFPEVVIICENAETVQVLPDLPGAVAVSGNGYAIPDLLAVPWVQVAPVIYWGDLDADGLRILDRARHHHPAVRSVLMDEQTLIAYRELSVPSEARPAVALARLSPEELALHGMLSTTGERLEQERIELGFAVAALQKAVAAARSTQGAAIT